MKRWNVKRVGWLTVGLLVVVVWLANVGEADQAQGSNPAQTGRAEPETWAPQFPRPGATKVFENERVIVWDQIYADEPFMHRHIRDELNILMQDGPIRVVNREGQASVSQHINQGTLGVIGYFKAGLGPHSEQAVDPNHRPRVIYIEFKGTEPPGLVNGRWPK